MGCIVSFWIHPCLFRVQQEIMAHIKHLVCMLGAITFQYSFVDSQRLSAKIILDSSSEPIALLSFFDFGGDFLCRDSTHRGYNLAPKCSISHKSQSFILASMSWRSRHLYIVSTLACPRRSRIIVTVSG